MGRSRGGLTTKIHAVTDARGLPITLKLTAGQAHDGRAADDMLGTVGPGQTLLADAAYDSNRVRKHLAGIGAKALSLQFGNLISFGSGEVRISWHGNTVFLFGDKRISNPPTVLHLTPEFTPYKCRNRIERLFAKLKHYGAIATRYEKHDANFLALVKLAATRIWLRVYESVS